MQLVNLDRDKIDNLHTDIEQWYADYLETRKEDGLLDEDNEWYLQLKAVFQAAYGLD